MIRSRFFAGKLLDQVIYINEWINPTDEDYNSLN